MYSFPKRFFTSTLYNIPKKTRRVRCDPRTFGDCAYWMNVFDSVQTMNEFNCVEQLWDVVDGAQYSFGTARNAISAIYTEHDYAAPSLFFTGSYCSRSGGAVSGAQPFTLVGTGTCWNNVNANQVIAFYGAAVTGTQFASISFTNGASATPQLVAGTVSATAVSSLSRGGNPSVVAASYDGTNARLYVNGALAGTTGSVTLTISTGAPLFIGIRANTTLPFFGTINEVAMFSRALTADEIAEYSVLAAHTYGAG